MDKTIELTREQSDEVARLQNEAVKEIFDSGNVTVERIENALNFSAVDYLNTLL